MHVDFFTVDQAAALWCGLEPSVMRPLDVGTPSEALAIKQMLTGAILSQQLPADSEKNSFAIIGEHSKSLVSRSDLETYARHKQLYPPFLFDTLAPHGEHLSGDPDANFKPNKPMSASGPLNHAAPDADPGETTVKNIGGRPPVYDWDSFVCEIVRRANHSDGLPDSQAELIRDMLQWFADTYEAEPAESAVKQRISKFYNYIKKGNNSQN
jgi:hypothetical protein